MSHHSRSPKPTHKLIASLLADCTCFEEALRYSWHSFRIGLATRLQCMGCASHLIQALCRWQSPNHSPSMAGLKPPCMSAGSQPRTQRTLTPLGLSTLPWDQTRTFASLS
eukprot:3565677-Pleurochrysis_carterae.AAC.4